MGLAAWTKHLEGVNHDHAPAKRIQRDRRRCVEPATSAQRWQRRGVTNHVCRCYSALKPDALTTPVHLTSSVLIMS
jgi:hypothetical protein